MYRRRQQGNLYIVVIFVLVVMGFLATALSRQKDGDTNNHISNAHLASPHEGREVYIWGQIELAGEGLKDGETRGIVGRKAQVNLAIEAPRAQQRLVQKVQAIGGPCKGWCK